MSQSTKQKFSLKNYKTNKTESVTLKQISKEMDLPEKLISPKIVNYYKLALNSREIGSRLKDKAKTEKNDEGATLHRDSGLCGQSFEMYSYCEKYFVYCEQNFRSVHNYLMATLSKFLQVICKYRMMMVQKRRLDKIRDQLEKSVQSNSNMTNEQHIFYHKELLNIFSVFEAWEDYQKLKNTLQVKISDFDFLEQNSLEAILFVKSICNFDYRYYGKYK
ncbi:hypothetical protein M0813_08937 [Anaeramoeba flamelloides]|uniref:Uncharacterized protein n=1 Tax=Anaeramoeba flamelloides TaxID=1746091 RepID=A0AAV7Y9G2_9EUKA|nr:hypothetical protein M0812_28599 [Anaeramoeba flamelloides]KAJ6228113.1 hypothetical protein M0813_08937 [Anaeramoeba flamelloides]